MPIELKLPDVGEGIAEGEVVRWLVAEGAAVKEDDLLVEILTDKANIELPSPVSGTFLKILAQPGQVVKVGEPIALIEPAAGQAAAAHRAAASSDRPTSASREATEPGQGSPSGKAAGAGGEVLATPVVRKLAKDLGRGAGRGPWKRPRRADHRGGRAAGGGAEGAGGHPRGVHVGGADPLQGETPDDRAEDGGREDPCSPRPAGGRGRRLGSPGRAREDAGDRRAGGGADHHPSLHHEGGRRGAPAAPRPQRLSRRGPRGDRPQEEDRHRYGRGRRRTAWSSRSFATPTRNRSSNWPGRSNGCRRRHGRGPSPPGIWPAARSRSPASVRSGGCSATPSSTSRRRPSWRRTRS